jgi:RNA polymerase sigma-70 factor (ECF subfamily)
MREDASDAELATAIAAGGELGKRAESLLCRRFAPRVRLYGLRHTRDEDRSRELAQIVLLGVLQAARAGRIEDPSKLDRFVLGTCRNTLLRMREVAARTRPAEDAEIAALIAPATERVELGPLMSCFGALDERAQLIVRMSFNEERPAEEIGSALSMTALNVRVARHRALQALRQCLEGKEARL